MEVAISNRSRSHADHTVSHGVFKLQWEKEIPVLQNLAFYKSFMWDGGVFNFNLQPLAPLENHVEMDEQPDHVLNKLNQSAKYKALFKNAFGNDEITSGKMLRAL